MKATVKLYESQYSRSMVLGKQNGVNNTISSDTVEVEGMSREEFIEMAKSQLEEALGQELELDVQLKTVEEAKSMKTEDIEKALSTKGKVTNITLREILDEVYLTRTGKAIPNPDEEEEEQKEVEAHEKSKKEKKQKKEKKAKEPKEPRPLKKMFTNEELQARLEVARTKRGSYVKFLCTKTKKEEVGIIRSARLDKRSGFIQYRIEILDPENTLGLKGKNTYRTGIMFGKGDDSKDITFLDTETVEQLFPTPEPEPEPEKPAKAEKPAKEKKEKTAKKSSKKNKAKSETEEAPAEEANNEENKEQA